MNQAIGTDSQLDQLADPAPAHGPLTALRWTVGALCLGGFVAMLPLLAPLLLSAWAAIIALPWQHRLARALRHRKSAAAALISVVLVIAFLLPLLIAVLSLSSEAVQLGQRLSHSQSSTDALKALSSGASGASLDLRHPDFRQAVQLVQRHGASAFAAMRTFFGAATVVVINLVVFVAGFYTFLVQGERMYEWLLERSPLLRAHAQRLGNAFAEVGRGLLIGTGLTALLQGALATVGYLVTGVPQAFVLGLLTVFASLIPSVGSGLVWFPVAVGLAVSGKVGAAIAMLVIGGIVSTADNLVRPIFARYAQLRLNSLVLFIAMLGGIVVFGGWGLLLGPLFVRLASEGLTMLKEHREALSEATERLRRGRVATSP